MFYDNENDLHLPSKSEIKRECEKIRESWSKDEYKVRKGLIVRWDGNQYYFPSECWTAPVYSVRYSFLGYKSFERMTNVYKKE